MLTIGQILKDARLKRNLTLQEVEKHIKIREKYLKALEENRWEVFPSQVYIIGIIKTYTSFLNLDTEKILAFFRRDYEKKEEINFKRRISSFYLTPDSKRIFAGAIFLIFFTLFFYFAWQFQKLISPPKITFLSPQTRYFFTEKKILIRARVEKETIVNIFGERVYPNHEGIIEYELPLKKGENPLLIELIGSNGKKAIVKEVFYKR